MFSESNLRNLRQDFLIGSDLERCQSLNQSAETRRLSHLGSGQCPWELHWDKERNRCAKKSGVLGRQNIVDIFFICTQGCGWTPLVRHLLKPFLELMLEFVKKKKKMAFFFLPNSLLWLLLDKSLTFENSWVEKWWVVGPRDWVKLTDPPGHWTRNSALHRIIF